MKPTLAQAKKRYKSHTRGLLTAEFKKYCDTAKWGDEDGYPVLRTGETIHLHFRMDEYGAYACVGKPSRYRDGESASCAFGKGDR
jgi:hypothetical protein